MIRNTTVSIVGANIYINSISLEELLNKIYQKGKLDAFDTEEKVTFIQLSEELAQKGRKLSPKSLNNKALAANVKVFKFDGKRNAVYRKDIRHFISL